MENNNIQPMDAQEMSNVVSNPRRGFPSEEAMRAYYQQLTNIVCLSNQNWKSEYDNLIYLKNKLKQFIKALQLIDLHDWGKGITEIQNACGTYMLQKEIPSKTLLQTNNEIGQHLHFIMQLAGNVAFLKQIESILHYHHKNVDYLLKMLREEKEVCGD